MEVKGKIICKKSDNKAFKLGEDWYNVNDNVVSSLEKFGKGSEVVVTFEKKGVSRYVSKLVDANEVTQQEGTKTSEFSCEVCGKALKDGKFKKCYECNKSGAIKKGTTTTEQPKGGTYTPPAEGVRYGSKEDIAGKEKGCALGAAATVASGCGFSDPETAAQFVKALAESLLNWMRERE